MKSGVIGGPDRFAPASPFQKEFKPVDYPGGR